MEIKSTNSHLFELVGKSIAYFAMLLLFIPRHYNNVNPYKYLVPILLISAVTYLYVKFTLYNKYTIAVQVLKDQLIVTYLQGLRKKSIYFPVSTTSLELRFQARYLRMPQFYTLVIIENGQPKYWVNSKEGFDEKTLTDFLHEYARLQYGKTTTPTSSSSPHA